MKRTLKTTADGSNTLYVPELDEHYHSIHGAYREAMHVFINSGFEHVRLKAPLRILEIGFGTGLNALLTLRASIDANRSVEYTGVEKYLVTQEELKTIDYTAISGLETYEKYFHQLHDSQNDVFIDINNLFKFRVLNIDFFKIPFESAFDLIYFDAFGPRVQADLWTLDMFNLMYRLLDQSGVLVTYCAKGQVRRDMIEAGFQIERLEGPPGKREMLRATKHV